MIGMSDSEIRLGEWQTFQKNGAAGARCVPTMVGRAARKILRSRQPFLIGKWPLLGAIPLVGAQRSSQAGPAAFPLRTLSEWRLKRSAGLRPSASRFVPNSKVGRQGAKTAEPKMAFNFAHLLSAACGGAPRRLGRPAPLGYPHRKIALFAVLCELGALGVRLSTAHPGPGS